MGDLLQIANQALMKLGIQELMSLTQEGPVAARCNAAVVDIVKEVLGEHPFSYATVWDTIPLIAEAPPFGYEFAYQLPKETVKLIGVRASKDLKAPRINFKKVKGNVVYTDASPCYARLVVYLEADLADATPLFINACAMNLGAEIATPLAKSDKVPLMTQLYQYYLDRAILSDSAESYERQQDPNRTTSILAVREYPGAIGDYNIGENET